MSADPADYAATGGSSSPQPGGRLTASLERLRALLLEEGGLIGGLVAQHPDGGTLGPRAPVEPPSLPGPAQVVAAGPRVDGRGAEYELLIETIYEGYLLHYHAPRVMNPPEQDLGLLAGDRLYALGLASLVKLGDVEAVAELADVITLTALAHGGGNPALADAVWMAGAHAVGWGASPRHDRAKGLTRAGSPDALEAMRSVTSS